MIIKSWTIFSDMIVDVFCALGTILLISVLIRPVHTNVQVVHLDIAKTLTYTTDTRFLSVGIGSMLIAQDFKKFNMTSPHLQKLMSALSPGYLRVGGTAANKLWFVSNYSRSSKSLIENDTKTELTCEQRRKAKNPNVEDFIMSGKQWLDLNKLASNTGLQILFDINGLIRFSNGSWNSSNAEELIEFSNRHNLSVIWQLGNEPNLYKSLYNYEISGEQLANDFINLRSILNRYTLYKDALLVGPDCIQPRPQNKKYFKQLKSFLKGAGSVIDALTWHHYNLKGRTASETDFLNPDAFNKFKLQIIMIQDTLKAAGLSKTRIWLGETGSATGGGAPCISDRFIASFLWLDKLGVAAQNGLDIVIRQALFKGYYALLEDDLTPLPDYWVSVIYKQLVGTKVVPCNNINNSTFVRLYCHCTNKQASSITVFGINFNNTQARIRLTGILSVPENISAYILTSASDLLSKKILLNNEVLAQLPNGDNPQFKPNFVKAQPDFVMPPFSLGFWVVPSSSFHFC